MRIADEETEETVSDALNNSNNKIQVIYNTKKTFPVKNKTNPHHQHNVVHHAECPKQNCSSNYTHVQTRCKRVIQHNKTEKELTFAQTLVIKQHQLCLDG